MFKKVLLWSKVLHRPYRLSFTLHSLYFIEAGEHATKTFSRLTLSVQRVRAFCFSAQPRPTGTATADTAQGPRAHEGGTQCEIRP